MAPAPGRQLASRLLCAICLVSVATLASAAACGTDCVDGTADERLVFTADGGKYYTAQCGSVPAGTLPKCTHFWWTGAKRVASCAGVNKCFAEIQLQAGGPKYWLYSHDCGNVKTTPIGSLDTTQCAPSPCDSCETSLSNAGYRRVSATGTARYFDYPCSPAAVPWTALSSCSEFWYTGRKRVAYCGDASYCFIEMQLTRGGSSKWLLSHQCGQWYNTPTRDYNISTCGGAPASESRCNNCAESGNKAADRWIAADRVGEAFTTTCAVSPTVMLPPCSKFYFTGNKRLRECSDALRCYAEVQLTPGGPKYWMFSHICGQSSVIVDETYTKCSTYKAPPPPPPPARPPPPPPPQQATCSDGCGFGAPGERVVATSFGNDYYTSKCADSSSAKSLPLCTRFIYLGSEAVECFPGYTVCYAQIQLTAGGPVHYMFSHRCGYKSGSITRIDYTNNPRCGGEPTTCSDCKATDPAERLIFRETGGQYYSSSLWDSKGEMSYTAVCSDSPVNIISKCGRFWYTGVKQAFDCGGQKRCYVQMQLAKGSTSYWLYSHDCGSTTTAIGDLQTTACTGPPTGTYCWGSGFMWPLGNNVSGVSSTPVRVLSNDVNYATTTAASSATFALAADGQTYCWGTGDAGLLTSYNVRVPTVMASLPKLVQISAAFDHACGITAARRALCWGKNYGAYTSPTEIAGYEFVFISSSMHFTCALDAAGAAYCWGHYASWLSKGQMGDGSSEPSATPVKVSGGHSFVSIGAGYTHVCGLKQDGSIFCWGNGRYGQCGNGQGGSSSMKFPTPVQVDAGGRSFSQLTVATLGSHSCALDGSTGAAYCWGFGYNGQLGNGIMNEMGDGKEYVSLPTQVQGGFSFSQIDAGGSYTCGILKNDGKAMCWGGNDNGALGNGGTSSSATPVQVLGGYSFAQLSAGDSHVCGILSTPTVAATCDSCVDTQQGNRLIRAGMTGSFYAAANPTCAASVPGTLAPCSTVWYTGRKQAINCDGTIKCYAQIQLTPGGGGPNYWLFSHNCLETPSIVDTNYTKCGGAPVEPASCNNCAESGNTAGDRWTAASPGTFGEAFTTTCGTTPDAKLPPCSKFYFTGQKRARDCGGTMRCYAEAQLTPGGPKYWMFSHVCGQDSVIGDEKYAGLKCAPPPPMSPPPPPPRKPPPPPPLQYTIDENGCPRLTGFIFYQGKDVDCTKYKTVAPGCDIGRLSSTDVVQLAKACASDAKCLAFNTNGYRKAYLPKSNTLNIWSTAGKCQGLYFKIPMNAECPWRIPDFRFHWNKDITSQATNFQPRIERVSNWQLADSCLQHRSAAGTPDCFGFVRDAWGGGHCKSSIPHPDSWAKKMAETFDSCDGMYVKACPIASGYTFYPLVEWQGDEVARLSPATLASLAAKCNSLTTCKAFTTSGSLKSAVPSMDKFTKLSGDPCRGLYVRSSIPVCPYATPAGYTFVPQRNSLANDLVSDAVAGTRLGNVPALAAACTASADCAGFNTGGYLKKWIKPAAAMYSLPGSIVWPGGRTGMQPGCEGIYIRSSSLCSSTAGHCASSRCCGGKACCLDGQKCCTGKCVAGTSCPAPPPPRKPPPPPPPGKQPPSEYPPVNQQVDCGMGCKFKPEALRLALPDVSLPIGGIDLSVDLPLYPFVAAFMEIYKTTTCAVAIDGKEIYSWGGLNNLPLPPNVVTVLKAMMGARYDWLKSMAVDPDHKYLFIIIEMPTLKNWVDKKLLTQTPVLRQLQVLTNIFSVLKTGFALAANPCTQEYQFAFNGVSTTPVPLPGIPWLTFSASLDAIGATLKGPVMKSSWPGIAINTDFVTLPGGKPYGVVLGNIYFKASAKLALLGLDGDSKIFTKFLEINFVKATAKLLINSPHIVSGTLYSSALINLEIAPSVKILGFSLPVNQTFGKISTTMFADNSGVQFNFDIQQSQFVQMLDETLRGLPDLLERMLWAITYPLRTMKLSFKRIYLNSGSAAWGFRVDIAMQSPFKFSELKKYEGDKLAGFFIKAAVKLLPFFPDSMDGSFMIQGPVGQMQPTGLTIISKATSGSTTTERRTTVFFCYENADCPGNQGWRGWEDWRGDCVPDIPKVPGVCQLFNDDTEQEILPCMWSPTTNRYTTPCPF